LAVAASVCFILVIGSQASAQTFGRNKVRYHAFDFQVLETEHFDIYFYSSEREGINIAARLAERWNARLEKVFTYKLSSRQPLVLYASHTDFEETNIIPEELSEGTGGVTEPIRRRIILPLAGPIADTDHVIGHELVHAFQFDMAATLRQRPMDQSGLSRLPLWFIEGMAEYLSLGGVDANTAMKLRDAAAQHRLPSIRDLSNPKYFPYQWGHAVWAYIAGRFGDGVCEQLWMRAASSGNLETAITSVLGIDMTQLSSDWHEAIETAAKPVLTAAVPLAEISKPAVQGRGLGTELNVGPSVSPDGRWMAFLSGRNLLSTDVYIADTTDGRIVRKLTNTDTDPHFSSIQFIYSAGAWDSQNHHLAMATIVGGRPTLAIFNVLTGKREREIGISELDEIVNPAWSPDGHAIAFTGTHQGLTDLYLYDFASGALRSLTHDAYADLHPAWAPDSRRIVFATDRFSSNLESLQIGPLRLAIVDTASGDIEPLRAFDSAKHINPQWSPNGESVFFIADPDGVPNVFQLSIGTGEIQQITFVGTGVSGIAPSSPALSVSAGSGRLAFSVFEDNRYDIYFWTATPKPALPRTPLLNAATLPPNDRDDRDSGVLGSLLAHPEEGLPPAEDYPAAPYKAKLSLTGVAQPTAGVGFGSTGPAFAGGGALLFSDMLGDHLLATSIQSVAGLTGSFSVNDIAFESGYYNLRRRWNWGVSGGQAPYLLGGTYDRALSTTEGGQPLETYRQTYYRETQRNATGVLAYPFDRSRRVEFHGGLSQTSFEQIVNTSVRSPANGRDISESSQTIQFAQRLNLATAGAALVFDTANFGPTSPIEGERYRVEVSPAFGSIHFTSLYADYRRYTMPVRFYTLAFRVTHYGRYGQDSDDVRLYPVYLNYPGLVRGYDSAIELVHCTPTSFGGCQPTGRLAGSRILVSSMELRFPMLRPFGVNHKMYGPVPVELAAFVDSGVAWNNGQKPAVFGGSEPGISSAGLAARVNFGVFVGEFDLMRAFQRPGHGWEFGFNLVPGW